MAILWVASYPRSGSTWARAVISNLLDERPPVDFYGYTRYVPHEASAYWYQQFEGIEKTPGGPQRVSMEYRNKVQDQLAVSQGNDMVIVKTHNALGHLFGLPIIRADLTASAIYIARDPRDVALSIAATYDMTLDEAIDFLSAEDAWIGPKGEMGSGQMFEMLGDWSNHVRSWAKAGSAILRYEDFFDKLEPFQLIASVLKIHNRDILIKKVRDMTRFDRVKKLEEQARETGAHSGAPVMREGKAGAWKKALSTGQAKRIEFNHADVMRRLHYI